MKRIANSFYSLSLVLILTVAAAFSFQKKTISAFSQEDIRQAIMNDRWDFAADYVMPSTGRSKSITGEGYFVKCRKDSLQVSLPYFGRVTSPAGAMTENPLDFKSTNSKIEKEEKKKGKWYVTVKPENTEARTMTFTFFDNGTAQLSIVMQNRSPISFNGKVSAPK